MQRRSRLIFETALFGRNWAQTQIGCYLFFGEWCSWQLVSSIFFPQSLWAWITGFAHWEQSPVCVKKAWRLTKSSFLFFRLDITADGATRCHAEQTLMPGVIAIFWLPGWSTALIRTWRTLCSQHLVRDKSIAACYLSTIFAFENECDSQYCFCFVLKQGHHRRVI